MLKYLHSESLCNTLYIGTQMLKKIPSDKTNSTKNALLFLSQAPTHHSFAFYLWFLCEVLLFDKNYGHFNS